MCNNQECDRCGDICKVETFSNGIKLCDFCLNREKMTEQQVKRHFIDVAEHIPVNDIIMKREAFNNYCDALHKDNQISNELVNRIVWG